MSLESWRERLVLVLIAVFRFRQILFNLVSNAIKFTPEKGSVGLMLNSPDTDRPEDVELTVTDTGIGIPDCHMPRIFSVRMVTSLDRVVDSAHSPSCLQSFTQVDASVSRSYGGSGLGLAICKRLCDAMGGLLECTSELGKGTTFRYVYHDASSEAFEFH